MTRGFLVSLVLFSTLHVAYSDYPCVCNYDIERNVYPQKSGQAQPIGYMYEFDCKAQHGQAEGKWIPVAFEHKVGYILKDSQILIQVCAGNIPTDDLVITTMAQSTPTTTEISSSSSSVSVSVTTSTTILNSPVSNTLVHSTITSGIPFSSKVSSPPTMPFTSNTTSKLYSTISSMPIVSSTASTPVPSVASTVIQTTTVPNTFRSTTRQSYPPTTQNTTKPLTATTRISRSSATTSTSSFIPTSSVVTTIKPTYATTQGVHTSCQELLQNIATQDNSTIFAYKDDCFELLKTHTDWVNAELECRRKGAHLIDIASSNEQRVVYEVVKTYYHNSVWIGLHDRHHEESFEWTSGKPVEYINWYPGRFSDAHHYAEDCVAMGMDKYSGRWEDRPCTEKRGFICQFGRKTTNPLLIG